MTRHDIPAVTAMLRQWATGSKPCVAAIKFLVSTGQVGRAVSCGLVIVEENEYVDGGWVAYMDHEWAGGTGVYSSGERAILHLAASMHHGELDEWLWRMDLTNRKAFLDAISVASAL